MQVIYYDSLYGYLSPLIKAIRERYPTASIERRKLGDKRGIFNESAVVIGHGRGAYKAMSATYDCGLLITINLYKIINSEVYVKPHPGTQLNFISRGGLIAGHRVLEAFNVELIDECFSSICKSRTLLDFVLANMDEVNKG